MAERWTIASLLESLRGFLAARSIPTARLDAELLLAHVLKQPRIYLFTHFDQPISPAERDALRALAVRRAAHEPIAYILGEQEFYGHALTVDRRVLIPRPETEHVVDAALSYLAGLVAQRRRAADAEREQQAGAASTPVAASEPGPAGAPGEASTVGAASPASPASAASAADVRPLRVLDVGTGSGAIAVAVALGEPRAQVWALELSEEALEVAALNVARHGLGERVHLVRGDVRVWQQALNEAGPSAVPAAFAALQAAAPFDVIVSNPPYIGEAERPSLPVNVVRYEPALALFAESAGGALLACVAALAPHVLAAQGLLAMELAPAQVAATTQACARWASTRVERDLAGHERICLAWRGPWVEHRGEPAGWTAPAKLSPAQSDEQASLSVDS